MAQNILTNKTSKDIWASHSFTIDVLWVINPKPCKKCVFQPHVLWIKVAVVTVHS
jgi:hypothetical protein